MTFMAGEPMKHKHDEQASTSMRQASKHNTSASSKPTQHKMASKQASKQTKDDKQANTIMTSQNEGHGEQTHS
jgi:hypothetical protein